MRSQRDHVETEGAARQLTFPKIPRGWYYLCHSHALRTAPVGHELGNAKYAAFRDAEGRVAVLDARCSHMGADLAKGRAVDGVLHCPLHDWQYGGDGRCLRIPASMELPPFARQSTYPTAELGGHAVFHNAPVADYPMPFFEGRSPAELYPAKPFDFFVNTPWYLVGANAFDLQHFRIAHDRTLVDAPTVDLPSPFARRIAATYDVTGNSVRDRITRRFSGPQVHMAVTVWGGTLILVTARFRRTTSYGMVFVRPLGDDRTHLRTIVWVPRRSGRLASAAIDPIDASIRRRFIRAFMADDALRSDGVRYNPATLIEADREMAHYLAWLLAVTNGALPSTLQMKE
jgi:phenylpropionate dioxygenase-like ring-hydroxylating dioxygenase large terminal subunit